MPRGIYNRTPRTTATRKAAPVKAAPSKGRQAATPAQHTVAADGVTLQQVMRKIAGLDTAVRQLSLRIGATDHETAVQAPQPDPATLARQKLIAELEHSLAVAKGEMTPQQAQAAEEHEAQQDTLAPGTYTPQAEFFPPFLKVLAELPNGASTREVLRRIERKVRLRPADHERLSTGAVRWENAVMFVRAKAKAMGLLAQNTPRGHWQLSAAGRKFVQKG